MLGTALHLRVHGRCPFHTSVVIRGVSGLLIENELSFELTLGFVKLLLILRKVFFSSSSSLFPTAQSALIIMVLTKISYRERAHVNPSQKPNTPISSLKPRTRARGIPKM